VQPGAPISGGFGKMRADAKPFLIGQIRGVSLALHRAERRQTSSSPRSFQTVSLEGLFSEVRLDGVLGRSVHRRRKEGPPPPPPGVAADPKPGMIAKMRGPLSVKNHSFAVYARTRLGTTIRSSFSRAPLIPLQGSAARLFYWLGPDPYGRRIRTRRYGHLLFGGASWSVWTGSMQTFTTA
jgi:hypothetical protein